MIVELSALTELMNGFVPISGDHMDNLDPAIAPARELVEHIRKNVIPSLTSRPENKPRQLLGAVLARCSRLLAGMIYLYDGGFTDLTGIELRIILENWLVGQYLILSPDEAYKALHEANVDQLEKMGRAGWDSFGDLANDLDFDAKAIHWANVAVQIDKLFSEAGAKDSSDQAKRMYDLIYRSQSNLGIHAGIGSLMGHIVVGETHFSTSEIRTEPESLPFTLLMAAAITTWLAEQTCELFGIGTSAYSGIQLAIAEAMKEFDL
jgi:hypothetical protein